MISREAPMNRPATRIVHNQRAMWFVSEYSRVGKRQPTRAARKSAMSSEEARTERGNGS